MLGKGKGAVTQVYSSITITLSLQIKPNYLPFKFISSEPKTDYLLFIKSEPYRVML